MESFSLRTLIYGLFNDDDTNPGIKVLVMAVCGVVVLKVQK